MSKINHEQSVALYDALLATHPKIERKGKTSPYTSVNGHMFTFLDKEGKLGIRLSKKDGEDFVEKYKTEPYIQYNSVMKGYVSIPGDLLTNTNELKAYLEKSYDYISSLKPKPTKKKKK